MVTLANSADLCAWIASPSELRLVLRANNVRNFYHLERILQQYPKDARPQRGDEPQFVLPRSLASSDRLRGQLVGVFGARIVDQLYPKASPPPRPSGRL